MKKSIQQKSKIDNQKIEKVTEEFTGKNLTRFGGTGLIRRFFNRLKITKEMEKRIAIEGRRESRYSPSAMFTNILYGIFLGYSRPSHMNIFSTDMVFQKIAGINGFPVQSTISRFLFSLKIHAAREIGRYNLHLLMKIRNYFKRFKELTLDMDSHVTTVFGNQQRTGIGYNPKKKGRRSYHPIFCFIGETRDYIGGLLRSGRHHTSYNAIPFIKGIIKNIPSHIEKIRLRADSGFFSHDMIMCLIKNSIEFYIVVPVQPWVQKEIQYMKEKEWKDIGSGVSVAECRYIAAIDTDIRMVVIRKKVRNGETPRKQLKLLSTKDVIYDYQVIVTNSDSDGKEPEDVWRFYNQRACCENFIKEGIYGFGLDKVVSHNYAGNSAWLELLMLGYNLMNFFKEDVLKQDKVKEMLQTIRERLFLIPGKLVHISGRWILRLERTWFYRREYEEAVVRIT